MRRHLDAHQPLGLVGIRLTRIMARPSPDCQKSVHMPESNRRTRIAAAVAPIETVATAALAVIAEAGARHAC